MPFHSLPPPPHTAPTHSPHTQRGAAFNFFLYKCDDIKEEPEIDGLVTQCGMPTVRTHSRVEWMIIRGARGGYITSDPITYGEDASRMRAG